MPPPRVTEFRHASPTVPEHFNTRPAPVPGRLFVDGVSAQDVSQHAVADCFVAAALSSLAAVRPDLISRIVRTGRGDSYLVLLQPRNGREYHVVLTPTTLPVYEAGQPSFSISGSDPTELWPSIIEHALADEWGGYGRLDLGGVPASVFSLLMGRPAEVHAVGELSQARFASLISERLAARLPVALVSPKDDARLAGTGIHGWHSYSVIGQETRDGELWLHMRNPWGFGEEEGNGSFWMPAARAHDLFVGLSTVQ